MTQKMTAAVEALTQSLAANLGKAPAECLSQTVAIRVLPHEGQQQLAAIRVDRLLPYWPERCLVCRVLDYPHAHHLEVRFVNGGNHFVVDPPALTIPVAELFN